MVLQDVEVMCLRLPLKKWNDKIEKSCADNTYVAIYVFL